LIKALSEYETAMKENSRLFIFKHLFNALELAINFDSETTGLNFDRSVEINTSVSEKTVRVWREFYNRIKHVDKTSQDNNIYEQGMKNLSSLILPVRTSSRKAIMNVLNRI
jgi:hypothetical protein